MNFIRAKLSTLHQKVYLGLVLVSFAWLLLNLPFLTLYPASNSDEVQLASVSANFLETGQLGLPVWGDLYGSSTRYNLLQLYNLGLAIVFKLFGIGLIPARVFSLLGALCGAWLLFFLGQRLYHSNVGSLAFVLYLFSLRTFWMGHVVRPETWVIVGSLTVFLLFTYIKEREHWWLSLLLGLLSAVIVDIYITNVYSSVAVSLAVLFQFGKRSWWRSIVFFTIGGLLGTLYWFLSRLLPEPWMIIQQWFAGVSTISRTESPTLFIYWRIIPEIIRDGFIGSSRLGPIESGYMMLGIIGMMIRRQSSDLLTLLFWAVLTIGFVIFYGGSHHIMDLMPIFCLAIATTAFGIATFVSARVKSLYLSPSLLAVIFIMPLLIGYVGGSIYLGNQNRAIDYDAYAARLRQLVPVGSNVLGEGTWWWALRGGIYTADEYLLFKNVVPKDRPETLYTILRERKVQAILIDENLSYIYLEHNRSDIYNALVMYTNNACRLAGIVEGYAYGVEQGGPAIKRTEVYICPTPQ